MKDLNWRLLIAMGTVPSILLGTSAYYRLYESPSFLTSNQRKGEAVRILRDIKACNETPLNQPMAVARIALEDNSCLERNESRQKLM